MPWRNRVVPFHTIRNLHSDIRPLHEHKKAHCDTNFDYSNRHQDTEMAIAWLMVHSTHTHTQKKTENTQTLGTIIEFQKLHVPTL